MKSGTAKELQDMIEVVLRQIPKEQQAHQLYAHTAERAPSDMLRLLFEWLANQELAHEKKLRATLDLLRKEQRAERAEPES